jgi:branched-chain amino acid transport system substrate-binding protein
MLAHQVVWRPTSRIVTLLALGVLLLTPAGCNRAGGNTSARHLEIATLFAVSGTYASTALPAQYAVDLAVSQAHLPDGYTLTVVHKDYTGALTAPTLGATAAHAVAAEVQSLVDNGQVVGIVGPFNSSAATWVLPITNRAGLSTISPANTDPGLTLEHYANDSGLNWSQLHPQGHPNRYFRIVANDVEQARLDAYFASDVLGAKTAFVVYDNSSGALALGPYGANLAHYFSSAFTSTAGHVAVVYPYDITNLINFSPVISPILAMNPDLVYYGGVSVGGGAELKHALVAAGYTRPVLGGDGIANDPVWLSEAQGGAGNSYGTAPAPDVSSLTSQRAHAFVSDYKAFVGYNPNSTLSPYSVMAYDAANTLISALTLAIEHGAGHPLSYLRSQTGQYLTSARFHYAGITGDISFDENGDNAGQRIFSVYVVAKSGSNAGQWSFLQLYQCAGDAMFHCYTIPSL